MDKTLDKPKNLAVKNGIYKDRENTQISELKKSIGLHCSILRFPNYVLSEIASKTNKRISIKTKKGLFKMTAVDTNLPTAKHSVYFDMLSALFASNWNEKGYVYFRFSDLFKIGGQQINSGNGIQCIVESIRRYMNSLVTWENTFNMSSDGDFDWSGTLIIACNVFDKKGIACIKNTGQSKLVLL